MATSSSDCGENGYCVWEWDETQQSWSLFDNQANEGFVCAEPPPDAPPGTPTGTMVLLCAEPASS